ncbi:MAG: SDR family oxidoreductase [Leptonema sp. (in: bacteria)]
MKIQNKNILITGGGSGIGKLMAIEASKKGAHTVIIWDVNRENLKKLNEDWQNNPNLQKTKLIIEFCDVRNNNQIYQLAKKTLKEVGNVDILINNAGIVSGKSLLELSDEEIIKTFEINVLAYFWTTKAFLPHMIKNQSGFICNIISASALVGVYKLTDYASSKSAVFGFDESLRMEIQRNGWPVKNLAVCPFYINTGMFEGVKTRFPWLLPILDPEKVAKKILQSIEKDKRRLYMPWIIYLIPLGRLFPIRIFDWMMNFLGVNHTMDDFKGRKN